MKQGSNIQATVLIYTIVLVNISLLMAIVIFNNSSILSDNRQVEIIEAKLRNTIAYKVNSNIKYHKTLNSDGDGFVDIVSCPQNFTMSGSANTATVSSQLIFGSWWTSAHCSWTYQENDVKLYFNDDASDIDLIEYQWEFRNISWSDYETTFSDSDTTFLKLDWSHLSWDNYDDDSNSDDYRTGSTGSIDYPDWYGDNDSLARTLLYWYASPDAQWVNIFWNNYKTKQYIEDNSNNDDDIYGKASTSSWYIYVDADRSFDIRVVEFDTQAYSDFNQLRPISSIEFRSPTGAWWYIQADASLSVVPSEWYQFDFPNKDYAIFINNTWSGVLLYQVSSIDIVSWSGLYINPIKDDTTIIRTLGNDIHIDQQGNYISKQTELITAK